MDGTLDEVVVAASPRRWSWRRLYQFNLRKLLILVALMACGLGWTSMKIEEARLRRKTAAAIQENGGRVTWADGPKEITASTKLRAWSKDQLKVDVSAEVSEVNYQLADVTDDELAEHLRLFPKLESLRIDSLQLTNAALPNLGKFKQLKHLSLICPRINDDGLKSLAGLTELESLTLHSWHITSAGLQHLQGMTQLTLLNLNYTNVDDEGLSHLAGMSQLKRLCLDHTAVTGAGTAQLKDLPKLKEVWLCEAQTHVANSQLQNSRVSVVRW